VFGQDLAADFTGYVTISADKPLYLEALTAAWGKAIEGGVQYSNFPVRADASVPYTREISAESLQMAVDRIISDYGAVGISGAVVVHGHLVWAGASGNSFPGNPITSEMYFDIGSIAKNYVAALILRLSEQGLLSLEDHLDQWLPNFRNINSWVTIRQLLNHTSGIFSFTRNPNFWGAVFSDPGRRWTPEQVLGYVLEPYFAPGTSWTYSNSNYTLLGMIAERATGSSLSAALHNWLLEPLGLNHTFLEPEEEIPGTLAHAWFDINGDGEYEDIGGIDRTSQASAVWAAGGIVATAADVAKWACSLFEGKVLSTDSLSQMVDFREITMTPTPIVGYGLGALKSVVADREYWGHGGDMIGYTAMMFYAPEERVSMVFLLNQDFLDYAAGVDLLESVIEAIQSSGTVKLTPNE
jgi:D-alanyl-D-alanine carboxypeptidase